MSLEVCTNGDWHSISGCSPDYPRDHESYSSYYVCFSGYFGQYGPHVFAAAPDMLEALEGIYDPFLAEDDGEGACHPQYQAAIDRVKSAIAKAKGEKP